MTKPMTDERLEQIRNRFVLDDMAGEDAVELLAEVDRLRDAVNRVKEQHFPVDGVYADAPLVCGNRYCTDNALDQFAWPCPTTKALEGEAR